MKIKAAMSFVYISLVIAVASTTIGANALYYPNLELNSLVLDNNHNHPGSALGRVVGDVGLLQDLSVRVLTPPAVAAATVLVGCGVLALLSPVAAAGVLAVLLAVAVAVCMAAMLAGVYASFFLDSAPAPTVILILTAIFGAVFLRRQRQIRRAAATV